MTEPIPMDDQPNASKAEPSSLSASAAAVAAEAEAEAEANMKRKDKRKAMKKDKRKQKRKELAEKERQEEEKRLNDPEEQRRIEMEKEREKERLERERREFEERERLFLEELARKKALEEEETLKRAEEEAKFKQQQVGHENEVNEDDEWEYIEEGPPEIIWQGNEIIVKKNKVRVKKKDTHQQAAQEDPNRPTSNPLPPQSEAYNEYKNASVVSAQQLLDDVAQQTPNFGTEQDKANCPFHLKTGACRFGSRCSRVHFYPDKSCTLLIKNMYNGPGLAWEQDEGLEQTDEEIDRCYEEFYEDVHTEFLKFGEIINFKVSRNSSVHLRGNVYVHFKSVDSAVLAYHSINGRYFAGKQVTCEFINVTRWRVAICGEYMKSKLKTCSRGTTCNFIHCFRNPGGDYEWADWDKPPPRYWIKKMAALFGYVDEHSYVKHVEHESSIRPKDASKSDRYHSRRSQSKEMEYHSRRSQSNEMESSTRSSRSHHKEHDARRSTHQQKHSSEHRKRRDFTYEKRCEEETSPKDYHHSRERFHETESDRDWSDRDSDDDRHHNGDRRRSRTPRVKSESRDRQGDGKRKDHTIETHTDLHNQDREGHSEHSRKRSRHQETVSESSDICEDSKSEARHVESGRERSSKDSDKNVDLSVKRRTLRYHDENCISLDDHWAGRSGADGSDYSGGWSEDVIDSCYDNDTFVHASGVSDDEKTSKGKYSQKHKKSRVRDHSSGEYSEVNMDKEGLRSIERHGKRRSSRHEFSKDVSERNFHQNQEEEDSHDENVAKSDRWEPDRVVTGKHGKHR